MFSLENFWVNKEAAMAAVSQFTPGIFTTNGGLAVAPGTVCLYFPLNSEVPKYFGGLVVRIPTSAHVYAQAVVVDEFGKSRPAKSVMEFTS